MDRIVKSIEEFFFIHHRSPSITEIANDISCSRSTIHAYLREMNQLGRLHYDGKTLGATAPFTRYNEHFRAHLSGNYYDENKDGVLNGRELTHEDCTKRKQESGTEVVITPTFLDKPSDVHPTVEGLMTARDAYEWIVQHGGASLPARDQVDSYLVEELTSLGRKGGIILTEMDLPTQGPGKIKLGTKPLDTDNDGMPDDFEDAYGLDKNDPSDAMKIASNGYTNIENYIFLINK